MTAPRRAGRSGRREGSVAHLVAEAPRSVAMLLEAAGRARMTASLVDSLEGLARTPRLAGRSVVAIDASTLPGPGAEAALARGIQGFASPVLVVKDRREINWCAAGATTVLPMDAGSQVIGAQLVALLGPTPDLEADVVFGSMRYRAGRRVVEIEGAELTCSAMQTRLLVILMQARGDVVDHATLERRLHVDDASSDPSRLGAQVRRVRRRLDAHTPGLGALLESVRGEGYRLAPSMGDDRASALA